MYVYSKTRYGVIVYGMQSCQLHESSTRPESPWRAMSETLVNSKGRRDRATSQGPVTVQRARLISFALATPAAFYNVPSRGNSVTHLSTLISPFDITLG